METEILASELIELLKQAIEKYGDKEVVVCACDINGKNPQYDHPHDPELMSLDLYDGYDDYIVI